MRKCTHCGVNPRMNGVGSLCEVCWTTVPIAEIEKIGEGEK